MTELVVLFFILLFINFLLAAAEIALSAFGENKIEEMKEQNDKNVKYFEKLLSNQEDVYSSIHLAITFLNVNIAIVGYFLFSFWLLPLFQNITNNALIISFILAVLTVSIVVTILILIFIVLVPKAIAFRYSDFIGKHSIKTVLILSGVLKHFTAVITSLSNLILLPIKEKINFSQERPSEDEILDIISDGVKSGTIDETEKEIIENIFEFNDITADQVMIPRTEMTAINILDKQDDIVKTIIKSGHTLLPVYENSVDNIIGVLHTKDVMRAIIEEKDFSIRNLIRPAYFVPESKLISQILKDMQNQGERIAIVTDEYGGTEGVITMEDILEEIVGEIKDNTAGKIQNFSRLQDGKYYVLGSMNVDEFNETFNYKLPESDDYNTVAGFIADKTGKILNPSEVFEYEGLTFELIKKIRQKMVQFKVSSVNGDLIELTENETSNQ